MELQKTKEAYAASIIDKDEQAEPTSRCLPAHLEGYTEWREEGVIDGVPIYVYFMTTEDDAELAIDGSDWSYVNWDERVDRIEIDEVQCDRDNISRSAINALIKKYEA